MSRLIPVSSRDLSSRLFAPAEIPVATMSRSQIEGQSSVMPNSTTTPPARIDQTSSGIPSSAVVVFSRSEKTMIETARLITIVRGCRSDRRSSSSSPLSTDPPTITGRSGRTQGAAAVSTPARKETTRRSIDQVLRTNRPVTGAGPRSRWRGSAPRRRRSCRSSRRCRQP